MSVKTEPGLLDGNPEPSNIGSPVIVKLEQEVAEIVLVDEESEVSAVPEDHDLDEKEMSNETETSPDHAVTEPRSQRSSKSSSLSPSKSGSSSKSPTKSKPPGPVAPPYTDPGVLAGTDPLRYCRRLLNDMMGESLRHIAYPFYEPVDPVKMKLPDYYEHIRYPMDLGTIKKVLDNGQYLNAHEFAADVRLMISNCYRYNDPDHEIIPLAKELSRFFEIRFARFPDDGYLDAPVRIAPAHISNGSDDNAVPSDPESESPRDSDSESTFSAEEAQLHDIEEEIRLAKEQLKDLLTEKESAKPAANPPNEAPSIAIEPKKTGPKIFVPKRPLPVGISGAKRSKITQQLQRKRQIGDRNMAAAMQAVRRTSVKKEAPSSAKGPTDSDSDDNAEQSEKMDNNRKISISKPDLTAYESDEDLLPMSYDDKRALSLEINKLPYEKLLEVVAIVKSREPEFGDYRADEMEIDFNAIQLSTLREVEKFLRSMKRKRGRKLGSISLKNNQEGIARKREKLERELASMSAKIGRTYKRRKQENGTSTSAAPTISTDKNDSSSSGDSETDSEDTSDDNCG